MVGEGEIVGEGERVTTLVKLWPRFCLESLLPSANCSQPVPTWDRYPAMG